MESHEATNLLPMMTDDEYAALMADIREHGQREPIVLWQGKILDGRNRWRACSELSLVPKTRQWDGSGSPTAYVLSLNLSRRHLSTSQRAAVAVEALPLFEEEAKERQRAAVARANAEQPKRADDSVKANLPELKPDPRPAHQARDDAAQIVGVSPRYVSDAKKLKAEAPDLFEEVKSGERNLHEASKAAQRRQADTETRDTRAVIDLAGDDDGRVARAQLRTTYTKARILTMDRLLSLDPSDVIDVLDSEGIGDTRSFIARLRDWCDQFEAGLPQGVRLLQGSRG